VSCRADDDIAALRRRVEALNKAAETSTKPFCIDQTFEPIIPIIGD